MAGRPITVPSLTPKFTSTANLGGPLQGYSPQQTLTNFKNSENVMIRKILRDSWNTQYATGKAGNDNAYNRVVTPFRAINHLGDFLGRQNYVCGGPNPINKTFPGRQGHIAGVMSMCDGTGVAAKSGNVRFVPDSSDYTTFKKQSAINRNYNDLGNGGDQRHAACSPLLAVRRGF
jgi:hypothetical protein